MYLRAGDTISGQEGKATIKVNDSVQDLFFLKSLEATFEKTKAEIKTLGKRSTQYKGTGWAGSGTLSIFYVTSLFRKLALDFAKNGRDSNFTITAVNEDASSTVGKQTIVLYNCNIDSVILTKIDVEADVLDEEVPFTFDDFDILDEFGNPVV